MPTGKAFKSRVIDEKDKKILMILQEDGRESLTKIARKVGLSVDSVKKRMGNLKEKGIIDKIGVWINPNALGYNLIVDNKIKLHNITKVEREEFIQYLKNNRNVIDLLSIIGDYDLTCVIIAKNANDYEIISTEIRQVYNKLIADWTSMLILKPHKFEEYNFT
ncbi:MAG TPA: Lrp/AsnC family transcriptional regulator [archaeon]|nr:Lrp/AsnC family transcriptional regulator [archaeon]